jgi:DNA-binding IclR family transcriptional regulator
VRYTPRTVPSRDALRRELARVRRLGVAVDNAEYNELLMCVAAPLLGRERQVLGSIGISMVRPLVRRTPGRLRRLIPLVKACGQRASAVLAGKGPLAAHRQREGGGQ